MLEPQENFNKHFNEIASTIVVEDITHELHNDEMFEPQENFNKWPSTNTSMNSFNN
jgi:hypothetical protein